MFRLLRGNFLLPRNKIAKMLDNEKLYLTHRGLTLSFLLQMTEKCVSELVHQWLR